MQRVLAVNAGSSSLKLALFTHDHAELVRQITVRAEHIGDRQARLVIRGSEGGVDRDETTSIRDHAAAFHAAVKAVPLLQTVDAVGHRIVRGDARHRGAALLTPELLDELRASASLDPEHAPQSLALIAETSAVGPDCPQIACFDTAFHRTMPPVAQSYGLPRRLSSEGVIRLGFHGLSCEHVLDRVTAIDPVAVRGRLIVAHLGGGASLTAIRDGRSVETTMGFSPTGGLVMSTRSGDLDPSVLLHLSERGLGPDALRTMVNRESGLLGVSEHSGDMRELLQQESVMPAAAEAIELFCYTARKYVGAMVAVLGGVDTLVFTGGIGERGAAIRERICAPLDCFGIALDPARNRDDEAVISPDGGRVMVRVIPADEERIIAKQVRAFLAGDGARHVSF